MKFVKLLLVSLGRLALSFDENLYIQSLREKFAISERNESFIPEAFFLQNAETSAFRDFEEPSLFVGKFTAASVDELVKTICSKFPELRPEEVVPNSYRHVDFYMLVSVAETPAPVAQ